MKPIPMVIAVLLLVTSLAHAGIKITIDHNDDDSATPEFKFKTVPSPSRNDAATSAEFSLIDGSHDSGSGDLAVLHDGRAPAEADEPAANFFLAPGTTGGTMAVDLHTAIHIRQINTYSWHPGTRGPQVYQLYASDGRAKKFDPHPAKGADLEKSGWKLITKIDTRLTNQMAGGQYGVSIASTGSSIGKYRYLLFNLAATENDDAFGNTFYSEIDVVDRDGPASQPIATAPVLKRTFEADNGKYQIIIDPVNAPDLADWCFNDLAPVVQEWYPKLAALLPSTNYQAPLKFTIDFGKATEDFVAYTRGNRITCSPHWFRQNLRDAKGCVVHEMVHVVQHYGVQHREPDALPRPGWLVEGIADYVRWFIYEPQTHGANISARRAAKVHYNDSYRVTANFLNWAVTKYDPQLVVTLNAALREGAYRQSIWKDRTGHTVEELDAEWKASLASPAPAEKASQ